MKRERVELKRNPNGTYEAQSPEPYVYALVRGFPIAHMADVFVNRYDDNTYIVLVGLGRGVGCPNRVFGSFEEAAAWAEKYLNPAPENRLSTYMLKLGRVITSRYDGTDCFGQPYQVGDKIYYLASENRAIKYIMKVEEES